MSHESSFSWAAISSQLKTSLLLEHPLNRFTSWRVGGPGEAVLIPEDLNEMSIALSLCPVDIPVTWLGLGSNVLIRDDGLRGLVIVTQGSVLSRILLGGGESVSTALTNDISQEQTSMSSCSLPSMVRPSFENVIRQRSITSDCATDFKSSILFAEAGVPCGQLARFSARNNLSGIEFLAGIPGTVGGALRMNAGCYGGETWDHVMCVETIDRLGVRHVRDKSEFVIRYRDVVMPQQEYFLGAYFSLQPGKKEESLLKIKTMLDKRNQSQPTNLPNCGSVFKNPDGDHSARLIEACGLKGYRIGGAQISEKHANFIVNIDNASSRDVLDLIVLAQHKVQEKFSIELEREVKIL